MCIRDRFRKAYSYHDDRLWYKERVVVPKDKREDICNIYHDHLLFGAHFGCEVTFNKIAEKYYWPSLWRATKDYVASCMQCQIMKSHQPQRQGLRKPSEPPEGRWTEIAIDFLTGLPTTKKGYDMIMVVIDKFTKRSHFVACEKKVTGEMAMIDLLFRYVFAYHGFPKTITSDRDGRFVSVAYQELANKLGIKLKMSSSNHPQTNGQAERCIQVLNQLLRIYTKEYRQEWDIMLPQVEFAYNSTFNLSLIHI